MRNHLENILAAATLAAVALSMLSCDTSPLTSDRNISDVELSEFSGDLNLNGIPFEIADAVLFSNYFISGVSAFDLDVDSQIIASDVNRDRLPLTVADFVYLIRKIVGDALPPNKLAHNSNTAVITTQGPIVSTDLELGAALFVFEGFADVELLQKGLSIMTGIREGNTYALVAPRVSEASGALIATIQPGEVVSSNATLLSVEAADYNGSVLKTITEILQAHFALSQNYPNPFNGSTKISMDLPSATLYTLTILDTEGNIQHYIDGVSDAGVVTIECNAHDKPSGVYFYTMRAGDFEDTKSMILLK